MTSAPSRVGDDIRQSPAPAFRSPRPSPSLVPTAPVERATGKGRRRRAAAEQRRIEQQRWGESLEEEEDDIVLNLTPSSSRRRARRALRRGRIHDDIADYYAGHGYEPCAELGRGGQSHRADELEIALALSLSISGNQTRSSEGGSSTDVDSNSDLSYETLSALENVRVVAPQEVVDSLTINEFKPKNDCINSHSEVCTICQVEYIDGDAQLLLPCGHTLHDTCGEQWLCNYSRLCPVCKQELPCEDS
eukprot:TRINITY_DN6607_c0_g1_i1.p1 TRINITY_DN6607_c0_g1~~TRINITY_DN6607_c0_g1_i1.p1  ORF type:complete len:248 (-),score=29.57 TRINITY_DN6607_c0_g1_i1:960-1703(-)